MTTVVDDPTFDPRAAPVRAPSTAALFADPAAFDVTYVINAHMEGRVGTVDRARARRQWEAVRQAYADAGLTTHVLPPVEGLPDLCFIANQSLPVADAVGGPAVLLSRMTNAERRPEVPHVASWFADRGWRLLHLPDTLHLEGMGDGLWHPGHRVLYGGFGFRSHHAAWALRPGLEDVPVVTLELIDDRFYHLDTCLSPLDPHTALVVPEAFTPAGRRTLARCFPRLLRCPLDEAVGALACNGHCPDGRTFIVDREAPRTAALVASAGFDVVPVDTSEFRKSGGSVQCLKLMLD